VTSRFSGIQPIGPIWLIVSTVDDYTSVKRVMITARSELRKVLFLAPSVCDFLLCIKYLGNRWSPVGTSLKVKVKGQGHQRQINEILALSPASVRLCSVKHP